MRSSQVWIWCLTVALGFLTGCEAKLELHSSPVIAPPTSSQVYELKEGTVTMQVQVLSSKKPMTWSATRDTELNTWFVSRTEHDCKNHISTIRYLATYDKHNKLIAEAEIELELTVKPGSLGDAELKLACIKGDINV